MTVAERYEKFIQTKGRKGRVENIGGGWLKITEPMISVPLKIRITKAERDLSNEQT
jgi:hypothetical protein